MRTFNMQQYRSHSMYKLHTYECKNFFKANNDKNKEIFVPPTVSGKKQMKKVSLLIFLFDMCQTMVTSLWVCMPQTCYKQLSEKKEFLINKNDMKK